MVAVVASVKEELMVAIFVAEEQKKQCGGHDPIEPEC